MLGELSNGKYWVYRWEDGGIGIVKADSPAEAEQKVRDAYAKHGCGETSEKIHVYANTMSYFQDAPDVLEIIAEV